jgi:hypothetical protein
MVRILTVVILFLLLSSCCIKPPVDVYRFSGRPPAFRIGCDTIHRCRWMAERLCGAAGYRLIERLRTGTRIYILPPGFVVNGEWETILMIECRFPVPKGE